MRTKLIAATILLSLSAACGASTDDATEQREGLLFGLTQDDVQQLHDEYTPDEDIDLTTARLTAPFDCALYDDLCEQISEADAIAFTEQLVDLGLSGASPQDVEAFSDEFLSAAMDAVADPDVNADLGEEEGDGDDSVVLRSSGYWTTQEIGAVRLRTRNGITTPIIGKRQAWTESRHYEIYAGAWTQRHADILCANTGANLQQYRLCTNQSGCPAYYSPFETVDPGNSCSMGRSSHKSTSKHSRRNGQTYAGGAWSQYRITATGSGWALSHGIILSVPTTASHAATF